MGKLRFKFLKYSVPLAWLVLSNLYPSAIIGVDPIILPDLTLSVPNRKNNEAADERSDDPMSQQRVERINPAEEVEIHYDGFGVRQALRDLYFAAEEFFEPIGLFHTDFAHLVQMALPDRSETDGHPQTYEPYRLIGDLGARGEIRKTIVLHPQNAGCLSPLPHPIIDANGNVHTHASLVALPPYYIDRSVGVGEFYIVEWAGRDGFPQMEILRTFDSKNGNDPLATKPSGMSGANGDVVERVVDDEDPRFAKPVNNGALNGIWKIGSIEALESFIHAHNARMAEELEIDDVEKYISDQIVESPFKDIFTEEFLARYSAINEASKNHISVQNAVK